MLIFVPAYLGQNYYEILGVPRNADQKEIKKSYRNLAKKHHPDKAQESQQTDQMEKINVAYETLSDPKKRKPNFTLEYLLQHAKIFISKTDQG